MRNSVIKLSPGKSTVSVETYLLDLLGRKYYGGAYQEKKRKVNEHVRSLADKYSLSGIHDIRKYIVFDLLDLLEKGEGDGLCVTRKYKR